MRVPILPCVALLLSLGAAAAACSSTGIQITAQPDGGSSSGGSSSGSSSGSSGSGSGSGSSSGSSGSGSSGSGSSSGGIGQECPTTVPTNGTPCKPVTACEYDADSEGACATLAECTSSNANGPFTWYVTAPPAGCGTHGPSCPTTFTGWAQGTGCAPDDPICDYAEGRCGCGPCSDNSGISTGEGIWTCQAWSTGGPSCPTPRPLLGSACTAGQEGKTCDYSFNCGGVPSEGPTMICQQGTWVTGGFFAGGVCLAPSCPAIPDAGTD